MCLVYCSIYHIPLHYSLTIWLMSTQSIYCSGKDHYKRASHDHLTEAKESLTPLTNGHRTIEWKNINKDNRNN